MAKLDRLPNKAIIGLFAGIVDFYFWKGIPVARSWPRKPSGPRTLAVQRTASDFGEISQAMSASPPIIISHALLLTPGTSWTWRDIRYRAIYGNLIA